MQNSTIKITPDKATINDINNEQYNMKTWQPNPTDEEKIKRATDEINNAKKDIENSRLFVVEEEGKIIAQCALVYEEEYNYYAIKRLVVYNQKNCGRGIAQKFISFFCNKNLPALGCTPWADNIVMKKLLERNGFVYQYTFMENYQFYKKD
mgnify:CR=1 FL=1